jgi:demethylmenaquinone methyltransferase/2-methoxy-6-polyprenyl-1,4-benzoquinol methylase
VTLRSTISTPDGKRRYVRRLFATIADRYDLITVLLSYGRDRRWKRRLIDLATISPRDRVLDLACGTGDLLFAAAERAHMAVGVDITHRMLELARQRGQASPSSPNPLPPCLVTADMLALPFADARFDVVTTGYARRSAKSIACSRQAGGCCRSISTGPIIRSSVRPIWRT